VRTRLPRWRFSERGQSLIETALLLPILLLLAFNAINFGYFFFVAVNLAAAPRTGVEYSIVGSATPHNLPLPPAVPGGGGSCISLDPNAPQYPVSCVTLQDITGALKNASTAQIAVCSKTVGQDSATGAALCSSSGTAPLDPEPPPPGSPPGAWPPFVLHRVSITYTVQPIIPAFEIPTPGGPIPLTLLPNLSMHRQVLMRAMD
jgi:hypothetical protein